LIEDLDSLPMPAWHLFDPNFYKNKMSRLLAKRPPATMAEFSRGCIYKCDFCASKMTMALGYRKKSPKRCAEEVRLMESLGWTEFMLADDIFTSHHSWAVEVCEEIIKTNTKMVWSCTNGIRVESADDKLFNVLKKAGCYRVSFGFESGNDEILKAFGKGGKATITQGQVAVKKARAAGIDTNGFFLLGLSPDTESSMEDTIRFARILELDMLKFGIAIAFPGTPMFNDYAKEGLIKSYDWDEYHIYTEKPLFTHRKLNYETILSFMKKAYMIAIFTNPAFIFRRFIRGLRTGEFFWDAYYSVKFLFLPATTATSANMYYAKNRWPIYDFEKNGLTAVKYQVAKKRKTIPIHDAALL
jgi:anaerobic magnesium-protoporphyrin IX monomethyl ester cyclase